MAEGKEAASSLLSLFGTATNPIMRVPLLRPNSLPKATCSNTMGVRILENTNIQSIAVSFDGHYSFITNIFTIIEMRELRSGNVDNLPDLVQLVNERARFEPS